MTMVAVSKKTDCAVSRFKGSILSVLDCGCGREKEVKNPTQILIAIRQKYYQLYIVDLRRYGSIV